MATPPEIDALRAALFWNNRWAGLCTIAVFGGLIVEYTILLWLKRKELSLVEKALTVIAGFAIAGGVYGEYAFGSKASDAAIKLESISEQRVADLNREAGVARKEAARAIERASENDARAKTLEKESLELRKQMVERGPRWMLLYGEQRKRLLGRVKPFAGQRFEIRYCQTYLNQYSIDTEAMGVVNILDFILKDKAQWIQRRRPVPIACSGGGIQIEVAHNAFEATRKAAAALRSGLIEIPLSGVPAVIDFPPIVPDSPDPETVAILVFAHP